MKALDFTISKPLIAVSILSILTSVTNITYASEVENDKKQQENILYAWFGDVDGNNPDFVATIDFDNNSRRYGQLITTTPLSGKNAFGNEPHHAGLLKNKKTLMVGGLLSVLSGQDEVFYFDVSNPLTPVFKSSLNVPQSSATDDFVSLPNGNMLVTMMGGVMGGEPGKVAEFDANGKLLQEWPTVQPNKGFNPHGISIRPEYNLMVTTDFVVPSSTINGPIVVQNRVRVWNLNRRSIIRTIELPNAGGTMDIQLIPRDILARAVVPGQGGKLWLVDTFLGTVKPIYDFTQLPGQGPAPQPHIVKFTEDGKRMFVSLYGSSTITMFDSSIPTNLKLLSVVNLGAGAGPHYLRLTQDEQRLIVTNYFLNEHSHNGLVQQDGNRKIQVINVRKDSMDLDPKFNFDGNTAFSTGAARPHAVVLNSRN